MRLLLPLLVGVAAMAQPFSAGIKAGVPMTNLLNEVQTIDTTTVTNRYLFGPEVEVRFHNWSIEFDALYRHFNYTNAVRVIQNGVTTSATTVGTSGNWELPLVAKYRFRSKIVRPYVEAGVAWDTLSGLKNTVSESLCSSGISCSNVYPPAVGSQATVGAVVGGGIDIHAFVIHVAPEIRFTRWAQQYFNLDDFLKSSKNQVEFLVGFTF